MKLDQNSYMEDNQGETFSPWTSYSDMFCSLMMVFILLFIFVMLQYVSLKAQERMKVVVAQQEAQQATARMEQTTQENEALNAELEALSRSLQETTDAYTLSQTEAQSAQTSLTAVRGDLEKLRQMLKESQQELVEANQALEETRALLQSARQINANLRIELEERAKELEAALSELAKKDDELKRLNELLKEKEAELASVIEERDAALSRLEEALAQLKAHEQEAASIDQLQSELDARTKALEETKTAYADLMKQLEAELQNKAELEKTIAELRRELEEARARAALIPTRTDESTEEEPDTPRSGIIEAIGKALTESDADASVDVETGAINLRGEMFFERGSAELNAEGRKTLNGFFRSYFKILTESKYALNVARITFEGHTDSTADYLKNMDLSLRRAQAVQAYCYSLMETPEEQATFIRLVNVNGCSFSRLRERNGVEDSRESRRVEIRFSMDEEE